MVDLEGLPGGELVIRGLADLGAGKETVEALVVSVASQRLASLGLEGPHPIPDPELKLHARLSRARDPGGDPYLRYNALLRELDSFLEALESRLRRAQPA